jgi:hypothetical protein
MSGPSLSVLCINSPATSLFPTLVYTHVSYAGGVSRTITSDNDSLWRSHYIAVVGDAFVKVEIDRGWESFGQDWVAKKRLMKITRVCCSSA